MKILTSHFIQYRASKVNLQIPEKIVEHVQNSFKSVRSVQLFPVRFKIITWRLNFVAIGQFQWQHIMVVYYFRNNSLSISSTSHIVYCSTDSFPLQKYIQVIIHALKDRNSKAVEIFILLECGDSMYWTKQSRERIANSWRNRNINLHPNQRCHSLEIKSEI